MWDGFLIRPVTIPVTTKKLTTGRLAVSLYSGSAMLILTIIAITLR